MVTAEDGHPTFRPVRTAQWDVLEPFPTIQLDEPDYDEVGPVHLLVRLGSEPLGYTDFEYEDAGSLPGAGATSVSQSFLPQINARLTESGLPRISEIPTDGLRLDPNRLSFVAEREHLLKTHPIYQSSYALETVRSGLLIASVSLSAKNTQTMRLSWLTTHRQIPMRCQPYWNRSTFACPCDISSNLMQVTLGVKIPAGGPRKPT